MSGKWMRALQVQRAGSEKSVKKGLALAAAGLMMIAGLIIQNGCASAKPGDQDPARRLTAEETTGIKIERIHPSAGGLMLDMRYRVVDAEKAKFAIKRGAQIYLVDQSSGTKLPVPDMAKVGKLLQRPDQGEHGKAADTFQAIVDADPLAHYAHFGLGLSRMRLGDATAGRRHLRMAVFLKPENEDYRRALRRLDAA